MTVADVDLEALPTPGLLIGGEMLTGPTDDMHPHTYAANGKLTREIPLAGPAEIDAAVAAARAAFPAWKRLPANERRQLMLKYAAEVRRQSEPLKRLVTAENGTPSAFTDAYPTWVAELFEYNAGFADKIGGQVVTTWPGHHRAQAAGACAFLVPSAGPDRDRGRVPGRRGQRRAGRTRRRRRARQPSRR
jgi:acyl-CoA reductase-like NAD-dependent aldehyde dehydrogenase